MAQKRMFSLSVVDTDEFLEMPPSTQCLYFHLGMHGDDDGFVSSPRKIIRAIGCEEKDLETLEKCGFVIRFESGIIVVRDWKLNNTLKNDRYKQTIYINELNMLTTDESGRYVKNGSNPVPNWNQPGTNLEPQHNITKQNRGSKRECKAFLPTFFQERGG